VTDLKSDWADWDGIGTPSVDQIYTAAAANAVAARVNSLSARIVTPEDFGAVGDGTTNDSAAIEEMFYTYATDNGGATILIPFGKVYLTDAFDLSSNTYVFGGGTLKCRSDLGGGGGPGGFALFQQGVHNVTWVGPTLDINSKLNVNGFDIGNSDSDTSSPYIQDIYIVAAVKGSRIATTGFTPSEDSNNKLFAGGGKGMALGFRVRNCYANLRAYDCDIAFSVESTNDNNRPVENVVLDLQAYNSHRTAMFISGGLDGVASSLDSGSYLQSQYPGTRIRLSAQGGQDASVIHPVSGSTQTNYDTVGVVTLNYASGIDLELKAATQNRCTLIRGMANAANIRVTSALMDDLQDVWDTRIIDTLDPGLTYMPDNTLEANVHAATHHGVVIRPHRTSGSRTVVKSKFDVSMWCVNGVGSISQSDGTTDEFGTSVAYRFRDLRANPVKEIVGDSSYSVLPTWSTGRHFGGLDVDSLTVDDITASGNLTANNYVTVPHSTATAAGTTTLTVADSRVQVFTGSSNQTVKLPTTSVVAGQEYTIINQSSGVISVQSSGGSALFAMFPNKSVRFTALFDTPTGGSDWQITGLTATTSDSGSTLAIRDTDHNLFASGFITTPYSTATAAGTTTLTISDGQVQVFTGTTTQTVKLPSGSVTAGMQYTIINNSTGSVTVQSSGANTIATVTTNTLQLFVCLVNTPTTAAHWRAI
jgi:hypothetical protein